MFIYKFLPIILIRSLTKHPTIAFRFINRLLSAKHLIYKAQRMEHSIQCSFSHHLRKYIIVRAKPNKLPKVHVSLLISVHSVHINHASMQQCQQIYHLLVI